MSSMETLSGVARWSCRVRNDNVKDKHLTWKSHLDVWCNALTIDGARLNPNWGASFAKEVSQQPNDNVMTISVSCKLGSECHGSCNSFAAFATIWKVR